MNIHVLLIEDDEIVQQVHQTMLLKLGCAVQLAGTGAEALQKAKQQDFHIVFVDIGLPDISGFEVISELNKYYAEKKLSTALIAVTGYCGEKERISCLEAGALTVLNKPVVIKTLRDTLNQYSPAQ